MVRRFVILLWLLLPASLAAQETPPAGPAPASKAAAAADKFSIELPADQPPPTPAPEAPVAEAPAIPAVPVIKLFSLDTPIAELIADPRAKAVLDRDLPGLSDDDNLAKFQAMSLRAFAPMTGGQMTAELMTRTAMDLAAITADAAPAMPPRARGKPAGR